MGELERMPASTCGGGSGVGEVNRVSPEPSLGIDSAWGVGGKY